MDAHTQLYAILGDPVEHSLSPMIHNAAFSRLGLNAVYLAFCVGPDALGLAFEGLRSLNIRGANLTIPLKELAMDFIDEIPEDVDRVTGAINTVVNKKGQLFGYNTDSPGFLSAVKTDLSFNPQGKNCLVLGAGGSARAVVYSLARARAENIFVYNRTPMRAQGLAELAGTHFPQTGIEALSRPDILKSQKIDLVVNCTACGLRQNQEMPLDLAKINRPGAVYDLVYTPLMTPFLKSAKALGIPAAGGLSLLVAQAALSFELWTGKSEGVSQIMQDTLKTCHL